MSESECSTRVCKKCLEEKDLTSNFKYSNRDKMHYYTCHTCANKQRRERRRNNPELYRSRAREYAGKNRDKYREASKRYLEKNRGNINERQRKRYADNIEKARERQRIFNKKRKQWTIAYQATHRLEYNRRSREWRENNKEKAREIERRYRILHTEKRRESCARRRARLKNAQIIDFTEKQWLKMQEYYDHRCVYCGKRHKGKLTQDHITPLSKGGNHTASNIVPACKSCNSRKHTGDVLKSIQPVLII